MSGIRSNVQAQIDTVALSKQGIQGNVGIQGNIGIQGIQGIQGNIGIQGIQGVQGKERKRNDIKGKERKVKIRFNFLYKLYRPPLLQIRTCSNRNIVTPTIIL